jgi:hypothetical protein
LSSRKVRAVDASSIDRSPWYCVIR